MMRDKTGSLKYYDFRDKTGLISEIRDKTRSFKYYDFRDKTGFISEIKNKTGFLISEIRQDLSAFVIL